MYTMVVDGKVYNIKFKPLDSTTTNIKKRILSGWNFRRFLFLAIGLLYLISSIGDRMWVGVVLSLIFVVQPILGIGCLSGKCAGDNCEM